MTRRPIAFAICLGLLAALPVKAAEIDVLKAIPAEALGFLLINRLDKTSDKLTKVAQLAQVPLPPLLMLAKMQTGLQLGVDDSGGAAVAVLASSKPDGEAFAVLLLPVTDYGQFVKQLKPDNPAAAIAKVTLVGAPSLVGKKGQFAVLTSDEEGNEEALQDFINSKTDVAATVKPLQKKLFANDIAIAITPDGVARIFDKLDQGLEAAKAIVAGGKEAEVAAGAMSAFQDAIKACQKEVSHFAVGIRVDDSSNIDLGTWTMFVPAGAFASAAKDATAPEGGVLAGLPDGPFSAAMGGVVPASWSKMVAEWSVKMMKLNPVFANMTDDQSEKVADVTMKAMKGMNNVAMTFGIPKPGASLYSDTVAVTRVDNSATSLANTQKSYELMSELSGGKMKYDTKEQKIAGFDGLEVVIDLVAAAAQGGEGGEEVKKMMQKFSGPDGKLKLYMAAVDSKTIVMSYVNPDGIARAAAAIKGKQPALANNADVLVTAGLMPSGGQWTAFVSPQGVVGFVRNAMDLFLPPGGPKPKLPDFPTTPPVGATAKMLSVGMETHLLVPAQILTAAGQYVPQVQAAQGGPPPAR